MGYVLILMVFELIGVFMVSRRLTDKLYILFLKIFRTRSIALPILIILLFPGTIIHELSHLFTAEILGVKTGKLTLVPESIKEERMQLGGVELVPTDPFRRSVIGLAPFLIGLTALCMLSYLLPQYWFDTLFAYRTKTLFSSPSLYLLSSTIYLLFAVSATMFSSKEDMKGVIPLGIVLGILGMGMYIAGIRIGLTAELEKNTEGVLSAIARSLSAVIVLNLCLYFISSFFIWGITKIEKHE